MVYDESILLEVITVYNSLRITAVVVAAGKGNRMNSSTKKQYLLLGDRPVVAHTLQVFQDCDIVDGVVAVVPRGEEEYFTENIVVKYGFTKVRKVIVGGVTRQGSVSRGLDVIDTDIVVIHDGVRPFLDCNLVQEGVRLLLKGDCHGTACAVPVKDTVKAINQEGFVEKTLYREHLRAVQTPQCFYFKIIKEVYKKADCEGIQATDDAGLLEYYGYRVRLYPGSYTNIKITTPEDMVFADALVKGGIPGV